MPIIRCKENLIHYAHIPKTGGHSLESYIKKLKGVELGFVDWFHVVKPAKKPWNISSPQHIDGASISRIFPINFFTHYFAVVRDPIAKIKSSFLFQKYTLKGISSSITLNQFIENDLLVNVNTIGWFDNHFMPQSSFLYPGAKYQIFKLEDNGLQRAKAYIDKIFYGKISNHELPHFNSTKSLLNEGDSDLSNKSLQLIFKIYKNDFANFKYKFPKINNS